MMLARSPLGLIPSWQLSMDPNVNPKINPHVKFPPGVYQTTTQPLGPWFQQKPPLSGALGSISVGEVGLGVGVVGGLVLLGYALFGGKRRRRRR